LRWCSGCSFCHIEGAEHGHEGYRDNCGLMGVCLCSSLTKGATSGPLGPFIQKILTKAEDNLVACCCSNLLFGASPAIATAGSTSASETADAAQEGSLPWNPHARQPSYEYLVRSGTICFAGNLMLHGMCCMLDHSNGSCIRCHVWFSCSTCLECQNNVHASAAIGHDIHIVLW
jgi:hypothetical protein